MMEATNNCEISQTSDMHSESGTEKYKEILKRNNIQDPVSEVIIKDSGLKGENMGSLTSCVTIQFENAQLAPLHLFAKRVPESQAHMAMVTEAKLFKKEAMFFMEYLPEVEKFCNKIKQGKLMDIYPKCYYADEQLVVLENLIVNKGFVLHKKEDMQDFDAAQFALSSLAKHHAISYAYIKDVGGPKEFFKRFADFRFLSFDTKTNKYLFIPFVEDPLEISINILSKSNLEGKAKAIEVLRKYQGKALEIFLEPLKRKFDNDDYPIRVLSHGDYWNNNMMFLKNGEKLVGHIMIDFQVTNFSTPAVDIGFYLFTSVKSGVRQTRLEEMLKVYLEVFVKTTKDLGYPIEMTYDELYQDLRETFMHGFLVGLGLCTGIGLAVMADADPTNIDIDEFPAVYNKLVEKWTEDNPEKNEENAKILVGVVEEHERLKLA